MGCIFENKIAMDIQWTDIDPNTGGKLFFRAARFGHQWKFRLRSHQRGDSEPIEPTREMWEVVLENLERRYRRREGVDDDDLDQVRRKLAEFPERPRIEDE
jgi:hypothetical protein